GEWRKFETLVEPVGSIGAFELLIDGQDVQPGGSGTIWIDDMALEEWDWLPRVSGYGPGFGQGPYFASFSSVAVHPNNPNIIYLGTAPNTYSNFESDVGGVWRTTNGGQTWQNLTRLQYKDNGLDSIESGHICGDGVCGGKIAGGFGRYEDCTTCSADCGSSSCCGNGVLTPPGETQ